MTGPGPSPRVPGSAVAAPWHCPTAPQLSGPRASPLQGPLRFMATITAPARHDLKAIKTFTVSLSPEISLGSPSQGREQFQSRRGSGWALHKAGAGGGMEQVLWPNFSRIARFSYPQLEPASETSVPCRAHSRDLLTLPLLRSVWTQGNSLPLTCKTRTIRLTPLTVSLRWPPTRGAWHT